MVYLYINIGILISMLVTTCCGAAQNGTSMICEDVTNPSNGEIVKCTADTKYGSVCYYKCKTGFALFGSACRRCQSTGEWSGDAPECQAETECTGKAPSRKTLITRKPVPFKKACCPRQGFMAPYNAMTQACCYTGRLGWKTPLKSQANYACGCCHKSRNKCWTCCEEPKTGANAELLREEYLKKEPHKFKIVGGSQARDEYSKMNAYLTYKEDAFGKPPSKGLPPICGGVLIHKRFVLTARHCFSENACKRKILNDGNVIVILGKFYNDIMAENDGIKIFADMVLCHEHYCNNRRKPDINDIALARLEEEVDLNYRSIAVASLPMQNELVDDWSACTLTGWGITRANTFYPFPNREKWLKEYVDITPKTLQEVTVPIIPNYLCPGQIRPCHLCAGNYLKDGCNSDSGSPLFCGSSTSKFTVQGIYSSGSCGQRRTVPGVYVRVSYYVDWINDNIEEYLIY